MKTLILTTKSLMTEKEFKSWFSKTRAINFFPKEFHEQLLKTGRAEFKTKGAISVYELFEGKGK